VSSANDAVASGEMIRDLSGTACGSSKAERFELFRTRYMIEESQRRTIEKGPVYSLSLNIEIESKGIRRRLKLKRRLVVGRRHCHVVVLDLVAALR